MTDKLDMIYDMVKATQSDVKTINNNVNKICVVQENHNIRMANIEQSQKRLEEGQKKIKKDLYKHIDDKKKHYNQGYKETIPQKIARKKTEVSVITIITTIIVWIVNYYFGG